MLEKMRNAGQLFGEVSGWNHPDTRMVVRGFAALFAIIVAFELVGCGGGEGEHGLLYGVGNPAGPWTRRVNVNVTLPVGVEGAQPRLCRVTMQVNDQPEDFVVEGYEGGSGRSVPKTIDGIRPGRYVMTITMKYVDNGGLIGRVYPSFTADEQGSFLQEGDLNVDIGP